MLHEHTPLLFFSLKFTGEALRFQSGDEDNFSQPKVFWESELDETERTDLVNNIAGHLKDAQEFIRKRAVSIPLVFPGIFSKLPTRV